jgi:6,7-dimethyl-8-ribityllumazine synthase
LATILIAAAGFYPHIYAAQLASARAAIEAAGHDHALVEVPGALELPAAIALAAETGRFDAYVAIGCVIRGETYHFEVVANESARGLMALTLDGLAVGNGILTVETEAQALARTEKAGEAVRAALALLALRGNFGLG